jgi:hypothetical protein
VSGVRSDEVLGGDHVMGGRLETVDGVGQHRPVPLDVVPPLSPFTDDLVKRTGIGEDISARLRVVRWRGAPTGHESPVTVPADEIPSPVIGGPLTPARRT